MKNAISSYQTLTAGTVIATVLLSLADSTADRESHPALKPILLIIFYYIGSVLSIEKY